MPRAELRPLRICFGRSEVVTRGLYRSSAAVQSPSLSPPPPSIPYQLRARPSEVCRYFKMPEGPELHLAARFINTVCDGLVFSGKVEKSEVSKNPEVPFTSPCYRVYAVSRGKEVKLSLIPIKGEKCAKKEQAQLCERVAQEEPMDLVFRFGMSGCFKFTSEDEVPKHAHLRFYTAEPPRRALCFVDVRRFGSWEVNGSWQPERGPCVLQEYEQFRENVMRNLHDKAFNKPICEALLNQKYFNGIGNYLRAEILYRLKIPPFVKARTVMESLGNPEQSELSLSKKLKIKKENPDLLELCHLVPNEVINLGGKGYDPNRSYNFSAFEQWLQCYYVPGMKVLRDSNKRTIWFQGDPGPMAPKGEKKNQKMGSMAKPKLETTLVKVTTPKRKRKSQSNVIQDTSIGANAGPPKKLVRKTKESAKKSSSSTTRKRKDSLKDTSTPQPRGRVQRPRRSMKATAVKDSPRNTPPVREGRRQKTSKEDHLSVSTEDAARNSQPDNGKSRSLKEEELLPLAKDMPKKSLPQKGRARQRKIAVEPVLHTDDDSENVQLAKGNTRQLKKETEPALLTKDCSGDFQPLTKRTQRLKKEKETHPFSEETKTDCEPAEAKSLLTELSLKESLPLNRRMQQLKEEDEPDQDVPKKSPLPKETKPKAGAQKSAGSRSTNGTRRLPRQVKAN
ncbi:endonuclease 8-like 1 [Ambystoma mexicanum]|uniref:endonuclease 8-like 1 n=1 Tax=Ambystoma mexicanum TaxID=8296 RepID=UPI0037E803BE